MLVRVFVEYDIETETLAAAVNAIHAEIEYGQRAYLTQRRRVARAEIIPSDDAKTARVTG